MFGRPFDRLVFDELFDDQMFDNVIDNQIVHCVDRNIVAGTCC